VRAGLKSTLFVLSLASVAGAEETRPAVSDFTAKNLEGGRVKLSDYAGKVVVVNFWATWCVPCLQELPFLEKLYRERGAEGLVVLAVSVDGPDTLSRVRSVVKKKKWTMPVLLDPDGSLSAVLNPRGTNPYTLFVDRRGRLAKFHEGYQSGDEKEHAETIAKLLEEPKPGG